MAIVFVGKDGVISSGTRPIKQYVEILADSEADITSLGDVITDKYGTKAVAEEGSMAYTADLSVAYMLSPAGAWTKFRG